MKMGVSYIVRGREEGGLAQVFTIPDVGENRLRADRLVVKVPEAGEILISVLYVGSRRRLNILIERDNQDVLNLSCGYVDERVSVLVRLKDDTVLNLLVGESLHDSDESQTKR
jgi:hypothetical protein